MGKLSVTQMKGQISRLLVCGNVSKCLNNTACLIGVTEFLQTEQVHVFPLSKNHVW